MEHQFDRLAVEMSEGSSRRRVLQGLGGLALGTLGLRSLDGFDLDAEAKNKYNKCKNK